MGPIRQTFFAALAMLALPFTAGCMPDRPDTMLSWDVNDHVGTHHYATAALPRPVYSRSVVRSEPHTRARIYTYQDNGALALPPPHYVTRNVPPYRVASSQESYQPIPRPDPADRADPVDRSDPVVRTEPRTPVYGNASVAFAWPVNGSVISTFGSTASGERNDGINIATAMGAPIRASASGSVTYAGNELKGYGNLVLLKHSGGYTTAYAHADRLVVSRGDFVVKGQVIGYSGQTGDVTSPQLHFEIRENTTPVNPRSFLMTQSARNS